MHGYGFTDRTLAPDEITTIIGAALDEQPLDGQRVLVLIPDGTRTAPMPLLFRTLHTTLAHRTAALDFLIALGTHPPMSDAQINAMLHVQSDEWDSTFAGVRVFNHQWSDPATFVSLGTLTANEVATISQGMLHEAIEVRINRLVLEYDRIIICGPVFPHEVVGFSGGNKYLFPGISGPEVINATHWLGGLMTNYAIIGARGVTPVRALINRAAALVPTPKLCVAFVVAPGSSALAGLYVDTPEAAWEAAANLSAQLHVRYVDHPFTQVLSVVPHMYDDIWTGAKGMYKLEPVVADNGELILYAPHITEFSYTHGALLAEIGYHTRDYFLHQWERFRHYPGGALAHSTHFRGAGTYDDERGEQPRILVTLATGISAERCHAHNLGYRDPATINLTEWADREDEGILLVPKAGELLYRLRAHAET